MTITIDTILPSTVKKSIKFKTKSIAPIFVITFSFFLNHLRIIVEYKYTKHNSIIICADINKNPTNVETNTNALFYPKQTTLTNQPIKKGITLLSILDTLAKFYPKDFS